MCGQAKKFQLVQVLSLVGKLYFAHYAHGPGFCRRFALVTRGVTLPHHFVRLPREVKEDLMVWDGFFEYV